MELLMSAVMLGLGGSLHCVGMCGPLALLIGAKQRRHLFMYHLARLIGYAFVGALFGAFGKQLHMYLGRETVGYLILLFAFLIGLSTFTNFHAWSLTAWLSNRFAKVQGWLMTLHPTARSIGMGLSTVLLPCGLLYAAFLIAMSAPNWWMGGSSMVVFALASSPALWIGQETVRLLRERLTPKQQRWIQQGLAMVGIFFLLKMGWNAITIPAEMALHQHHGHAM